MTLSKVLITGANGYIGQRVLQKSLELINDVSVVDIKFNEFLQNIKQYQEDKKIALFHKSQSPTDIFNITKWAFNHLNEFREITKNGKQEILNKYMTSANVNNVYKVYKEILKENNAC